MLDVSNIRDDIRWASRWDMDYQVERSHYHAHLLRPVLPLEELERWEEKMGVCLPETYRIYITQLGNGGAGPKYGIAPFDCPLDESLREPTVFSDDRAEKFAEVADLWFHDEADSWRSYMEYCEQTPEDQRISFDEWDDLECQRVDEAMRRFLFWDGQLTIEYHSDCMLLLNGSHRGFCHYNTTEYDYGYPMWYQNPKPSSRAPITWPQYRDELLFPFEQYFDSYVRQLEEVRRNFSKKKQEQYRREQDQVQEFLTAVGEEDWAGAWAMLRPLKVTKLSLKSRSLYRYYRKQFQTQLPDRPEIPNFFEELELSGKPWSISAETLFVKFREDEWHHDRYTSAPPFQDFVQSFWAEQE